MIIMTKYEADGTTIVRQRTIQTEDADPFLVQWLMDHGHGGHAVRIVLEMADGTHVAYSASEPLRAV